MSLYGELKRRNVFRVAIAYLAAAWLLSEVSTTLFPLFGFGEAPARIVVILLAIGFPLFLIFSWVFEITPEGLMLEKDIQREHSITAKTGKTLNRVIIVMLGLALGYFAFDKFVLDPVEDEQIAQSSLQEGRSAALTESFGDKSIAVLPFINMSSDAEQEYFADGISEELLNLLARIPELRVISRSSTFSFKGKDLDVPTIAKRLNVAHILEGSVRKAGNQVRITVQLIEARSDTHLWSKTYDRSLVDIFAIQEEIAASVAGLLKITLLGSAPKVREINPETYALFLQARFIADQGTAESYDQSISLYEQVLASEPSYPAAWVGLASVYFDQTNRGLRPYKEGSRLSLEANQKALNIDSDYAPAHAKLGWHAMAYSNDLETAARHIEHALTLAPSNLAALGGAAGLMLSLGRLDEAIALYEYVATLDPVRPASFGNLGASQLSAGQWNNSIDSYQTAISLGPNHMGYYYFIGVALLFKGEAQSALEAFAKEKFDGYRIKGTAMALYSLNRQDAYEKQMKEVVEILGKQWPGEVAHIYAFTGNADVAFAWMEKELENGTGGWGQDVIQPFYKSIDNDPRWSDFLIRVGCSQAQLDAIEFNVNSPK